MSSTARSNMTRRTWIGGAAAAVAVTPQLQAAKAGDPIVDTHMHTWSGDAKKWPYDHPYDTDFKGPKVGATVEELVADMDKNGVTHCILVQTIYHGWDNTYTVYCMKQHPHRFRAHGLIDPTDPQVADKLEYWMTKQGLAGMRFSAIYYDAGARGGDAWLTSPAHHRLWQRAQKLGAVFNLFIATGQLPRLEQMIRRYPGVQVVVDHLSQINLGGDNVQQNLDKLLALGKYPNAAVKVSELTSVSASGKYPFADALPWVKQVYEAFGPDKLLWGTGYPGSVRGVYDRPTLAAELDLVRKHIPFLTKEDKRKMLGLNAARIWKLPAS